MRNDQLPQATMPRVAVIGCGAAAKEFCLPVLAKYPGFRAAVVLVDNFPSQARNVAAEFGIENHCSDYQNLPIDVDAAIVTTPHHLHAQQSIHFLRQGKPVFVEKPLGMTKVEVDKMLQAAASGSAILMVNNCRRLFPAYRRVAQLIRSGEYGNVVRVEISDGSPFDWNSVSAFYLRDANKARGVFLDRGAHTVDVVCWWLASQPQVIDAHFDAEGGAEALMKLHLHSGQADIELAFSRLYKLENCYRIECETAQIRGRLFNSSAFEVVQNGRTKSIQAGKPVLYNEYAWQLLENFIEVIQGHGRPVFTASDVAPSISVMDQAYRLAVPFSMPWYQADPNIQQLKTLSDKY